MRVASGWRGVGRAWPGAVLAALALVAFRDSLFRGRVFYERDIQILFYGQIESFVRCFAAGSCSGTRT